MRKVKITTNDLDRLAAELDMDDFDPEEWATNQGLSRDAITTIAKCFDLAVEEGVGVHGIALTAFYLGWEAHKQFGRR